MKKNKKIVKAKVPNRRKGYRGDWTEDGLGFLLDDYIWVLKEMPEYRGNSEIKTMILCHVSKYEETINNLKKEN